MSVWKHLCITQDYTERNFQTDCYNNHGIIIGLNEMIKNIFYCFHPQINHFKKRQDS